MSRLLQIHRIVGITAGTFLACNGLTGSVLAMRPQVLAHFGPEVQRIAPAASEPLPLSTLLMRARTVMPIMLPSSLTINADPSYPVKVRFAIAPPPRGAAGPPALGGPRPPDGPPAGGRRPDAGDLEPPDPIVLVNPYTGELLARSTSASRFFDGLLRIHRSMWAGGGTVGRIVRHALSWSVLLLFFMALSGLYMRWPKGRAARNWRAWFKINFRLKGMAFLWNLHTVVGTCVLLIYLMTAHTGLMIGRQLSWYRDGTMAFRQSLGMQGLPPSADKPSRIDPNQLDPIWRDFKERQPAYRVTRIELPADERGAVIFRSGTQRLDYDPRSGVLIGTATVPNGDATANEPEVAGGEANLKEPLVEAFLNGNPYLHNGQRWGVIGQAVMMCAALAMPLLFFSGWMMYLRRRARSQPVAS